MNRRFLFPFLGALAAAWLWAVPAKAEPVFSHGEPDGLTGIVVTGVPEAKLGSIRLGKRSLRAGDIVTAQQARALEFSPAGEDLPAAARFTYLPVDEGSIGAEAEVVFSLRGKGNREPAAEDSALETYRDLPITGKLKASDPEGETLSYAVQRQPRRGTVELHPDGSFTYTPKRRKVGVDSFTYTAADPAGKISREAMVIITVLNPREAVLYSDTVGRDCRFTAEWMKNTGIFTGEQVGGSPCFSPEKTVTRGEFVTMLVKALDLPVDDALTYTPYGDEVPQWLRPYLAAAARSGLVSALPDKETFLFDAPIPTGEAAALVCAGLGLSNGDPEFSVEDPAMAECLLTREQAANTLYRAAGIFSGKRF